VPLREGGREILTVCYQLGEKETEREAKYTGGCLFISAELREKVYSQEGLEILKRDSEEAKG